MSAVANDGKRADGLLACRNAGDLLAIRRPDDDLLADAEEASSEPPSEKATATTFRGCPRRIALSSPVSTSQRRTVGRHLRSVYTKLGVNSRTAASAFVLQHGLISEE